MLGKPPHHVLDVALSKNFIFFRHRDASPDGAPGYALKLSERQRAFHIRHLGLITNS
jgi:hypothetical protein